MIRGKLENRVDLKKLTQDDFTLKGELRVNDESDHGCRVKPEFRQEGADAYVPFDQLFPEDKFHSCYEFIVQTPDHSEVVGSGYLHKSQKGDVSFGVPNRIWGQEREYFNSLPVWFDLLTDTHKPIISGPVDLIFVKVSPWHHERDFQRQRVLRD